MGGVVSAASLCSSKTADLSMLRDGLMRLSWISSMTLFLLNILSMWAARRLAQSFEELPEYSMSDELMHNVNCLKGYCWFENVFWGGIALLGGVVARFAAKKYSDGLALLFAVLCVSRGIQYLIDVVIGIMWSSSCFGMTMAASFWVPIISIANAWVFAQLALKFRKAVAHMNDNASPLN